MVGWFPVTLNKTIQFNEFAEGKPQLTLPTWAWFAVLSRVQQFLGLGHAVMFFCIKRVRTTLREYFCLSICHKRK